MKQAFFAFSFLFLSAAHLYADETAQTNISLGNPAYEFMTQGWGGEAIRGYESTHDVNGFFHRVGKVTKESVRLIKHEENPSVNDEEHTYQYDGMKIIVYLALFEREKKVIIVDVVLSSGKWPVKGGLVVGSTRKQIESALGKGIKTGSAREWTYGDGLDDVTYTFDKNDKVISIHWHAMLD
jgi:hypothetical protein